VRRVVNKVMVDGAVPPYVFKFDNVLVKPEIKFKANEEVDVLDEAECFIRGRVVIVEGNAATVSYNQENRSYIKTNVFKCGEKLPFEPCLDPTTTPIKIKFVPASSMADVEKKNIGEFVFDMGDLAKQRKVFN